MAIRFIEVNTNSKMNKVNHPTKNDTDGAHQSVTSFDISSLGQLEDIFSLGSRPSSPVAASAAPHNNADIYTPSNAVHMEIQENAKLPTFNLPVDRTNSSHTRTSNLKMAANTMQDLDEIVRLSEKDVNLTEMFLQSRDRPSVNRNYSSAGALLSHVGEVFDGDGDSSAKRGSVTSGGSNKGLHFVHSLPVPRSVHVPHPSSAGTPITSPMITAQTSAPSPADSFELGSQQTPGQQYPYHRSLPLPIPKRLSPETTSQAEENVKSDTAQSNGTAPVGDVMTAALATAAALASHRQTSVGSHGLSSSASPSKAAKRALKSNPNAAKKKKSGTKDAGPKPSTQPSPSQYRPAVPSASILDATKQRSQFGFGGNHKVPSVPLPPPARKQNQRRPKPPPPPPPSVNNSADAYERKKQKAKESRIKLNESIERTAIAINLSGTQSTQRATQLKTIRAPSAGLRANTLHTFEECARISAEAKKWDRPSFVGTAASLIQSLNSQCEALMSELLELKRGEGDSFVAPLEVSPNEAVAQATPGTTPQASSFETDTQSFSTEEPTQSSTKRPASEEANSTLNAYGKRLRLEEMPPSNGTSFAHSLSTIDSMVSSTTSMQTIAAMLDPRSLVRCSKVSRTWRDIFQGDPAWLNRCIDRFGPYNVRQWQDTMEAEHLPPCTSKSLYRNMDGANVKPQCRHEGSLFLGGARMPGKVSAWVSMVERSNGENTRSVIKESDPHSYTSLPVIELRVLIQNTGSSKFPVILKEQTIAVDASTRRRGEEMKEIQWDDRFRKMVLNLDGSPRAPTNRTDSHDVLGELCRLKLFESVILVAHIHARGCSTASKFQQKSNFTKILVNINGTTVPLVIPFFREASTRPS